MHIISYAGSSGTNDINERLEMILYKNQDEEGDDSDSSHRLRIIPNNDDSSDRSR